MGKAKVFERAFRVAAKDIDGLGHVNNVVYLRYARMPPWPTGSPRCRRSTPKSVVWVVRRHEIDYLSPAFEDDELVARTWVGKATAATSERVVEIWRPKDDQLVARVRSVWVPLDAQTQRPQRVDESLRTYFEDDTPTEAGPTGEGAVGSSNAAARGDPGASRLGSVSTCPTNPRHFRFRDDAVQWRRRFPRRAGPRRPGRHMRTGLIPITEPP